jgi:hypothetical protein
MTGPPIDERVQIVPLGFEDARLRRPIDELRADRVVAIEHEHQERPIPYLEALLADLDADERIVLERRSCDLFDLYDALGTIAGAIRDYETEAVAVNLSGGSTITAIAGMIACMTVGATPIYARPEYGPEGERIPEEPLHDEVREVVALPTYPIERPTGQALAVLSHLGAASEDATGRYRGVDKKGLIAFGAEEGLPFVADAEAESEKALYRRLDAHVLDGLREREYVSIERIGRRSVVSLTEEGENVLQAFSHLVDGS